MNWHPLFLFLFINCMRDHIYTHPLIYQTKSNMQSLFLYNTFIQISFFPTIFNSWFDLTLFGCLFIIHSLIMFCLLTIYLLNILIHFINEAFSFSYFHAFTLIILKSFCQYSILFNSSNFPFRSIILCIFRRYISIHFLNTYYLF